MAALKTERSAANVAKFLDSIEDEGQRRDSKELTKLMGTITGEQPRMWGLSIVGFGTYSYKRKSGPPMEWFKVGFAPRSKTLTLYIQDGFSNYDSLLSKLGKHSTGKACLHVRHLDDIDRRVLEELIQRSVAAVGKWTAESR